jgi:xanthine/uracil/vitamin C permease (AzgA family)
VSEDQRRTLLLAKLFDLRTFIGALFVIFGAVVTVEGLVADAASIAKASGINLSLWTGLGMLVVGIGFLAWMLLDPPHPDAERSGDLDRPPGQDQH